MLFISFKGGDILMNNLENSNLTGIKVRIETPLLEKSVKFYSDYLGLKIMEQWHDEGDRGVILGLTSNVNNQAFIELSYEKQPKNNIGMSIQIRVNSLDDIMNEIRGKINFSKPEMRPWGSKYLYLVDPIGITVILFEGKL